MARQTPASLNDPQHASTARSVAKALVKNRSLPPPGVTPGPTGMPVPTAVSSTTTAQRLVNLFDWTKQHSNADNLQQNPPAQTMQIDEQGIKYEDPTLHRPPTDYEVKEER